MTAPEFIRKNFKDYKTQQSLAYAAAEATGRDAMYCKHAVYRVKKSNEEVRKHFDGDIEEISHKSINSVDIGMTIDEFDEKTDLQKINREKLLKVLNNFPADANGNPLIIKQSDFINYVGLAVPYRDLLDSSEFDKYRGIRKGVTWYSTPDTIEYFKRKARLS